MKHISIVLLNIAASVFALCASAQDIHYTQFSAMPMVVDPAYTGMTNSAARAAFIYRNQWQTPSSRAQSSDLSFDIPVIFTTNKSYAGIGGQIVRCNSMDQTLINYPAFISVAAHKLLGGDSASSTFGISAGVQYGITHCSFSPGDVYFNHQFPYSFTTIATMRSVQTYNFINTGVAVSGSLNPRINFTAGLSVNNISGPAADYLQKRNEWYGQDKYVTASAGAGIIVSQKCAFRPAGVFIHHFTFDEFIVGTDCLVTTFTQRRQHPVITAVFIGGWYRSGSSGMITFGAELNKFQVGISRDILAAHTYDNSAVELMLRYKVPGTKSFRRKAIPSDCF